MKKVRNEPNFYSIFCQQEDPQTISVLDFNTFGWCIGDRRCIGWLIGVGGFDIISIIFSLNLFSFFLLFLCSFFPPATISQIHRQKCLFLALKNRQQSARRQKIMKLRSIVDDDVIYRLCKFELKIYFLISEVFFQVRSKAKNLKIFKETLD